MLGVGVFPAAGHRPSTTRHIGPPPVCHAGIRLLLNPARTQEFLSLASMVMAISLRKTRHEDRACRGGPVGEGCRTALEGVLDQVRTRLVQLVGELWAAMSHGQQDPTPDQVAQALQNINIVTGDNSSVTVTAPVAVAHRRGSARAEIEGTAQPTFPWVSIAWTALAALVAAAAVTAWVAWL